LKWCLEQEKTPLKLSPQHLMYSKAGELRSTKICLEGDLNFIALADFVAEIANGNKKIYQFLMAESTLSKHRYAQFYLRVAQQALKGPRHRVCDLAAASQIVDGRIVKRGDEFVTQLLALKQKYLHRLPAEFNVHRTDLPRAITNTILEELANFGCTGTLPSFFEQQLIHRLWR